MDRAHGETGFLMRPNAAFPITHPLATLDSYRSVDVLAKVGGEEDSLFEGPVALDATY